MSYVIEVEGRIPDGTLDSRELDHGRVRVYSVVRVGLSDDAALHGILYRLEDLAVVPVEFHRVLPDRSDDPASAGLGTGHRGEATELQFVVVGGLGEIALESLRDVCTPYAVHTRLAAENSQVAGDVLTRLASRGIPVLAVVTEPGSRAILGGGW